MTTRKTSEDLFEQLAALVAELFNLRGPAGQVGDPDALKRDREAFERVNAHLLDASLPQLQELVDKQQRRVEQLRDAQRAQAAGEPVPGVMSTFGDAGLEVAMPGGSTAVLALGTVVTTDPNVPFDVAVTIGDVDGEVAVTEVAFRRRPGGRNLGARAIQEVPTGRFIAKAVQRLTLVDGRMFRMPMGATAEVRRAIRQTAPPRASGQAGQRPFSDDELRTIADAYRAAPPRGRRAAVERAVEQRTRLNDQTWAGSPTAAENRYRYRVKVARRRIDPETGRPFLP